MSAAPSLRRLETHYIVMQAGFWAMFAAICAFQAALLYARGFSGTQTGLIMAVRCLAGIFFQPALGGLADRRPDLPLKHIVSVSLAISFFAGLVFLFSPMGLGGTLVVFIIIGGLEVSAYPLMDAMAIQYISTGTPIRYSLGRGMGSMAYAVCSLLLGLQVARWGVESVLVTHSALVAAEIAVVATFPRFSHPPEALAADRPKAQSTLAILRGNPRFTLMLCAILLGLTSVLPLSNFLVDVITAKGGLTQDLSVALFLMAGSELVTTFFFYRLLQRLGSGRLLLISLTFMALKALFLLLVPSLPWVYLIMPIQMLGYGLFTPASVYFVDQSVPPADRVRGQTLMMVASNGLGGVLGNLIPGKILDLGNAQGGQGATWMLMFCLITGAAGALLALLALRGKPRGGDLHVPSP